MQFEVRMTVNNQVTDQTQPGHHHIADYRNKRSHEHINTFTQIHIAATRRHTLEKQLLVQLLDRYKEYQATNRAGFGVANA